MMRMVAQPSTDLEWAQCVLDWWEAHVNELTACLQERRFSENLGVVGRLVLLCCQVWPGTDPLVHRRRLVAASHEGPSRTAETSTPVSQMVMVMNKYAAGTIN